MHYPVTYKHYAGVLETFYSGGSTITYQDTFVWRRTTFLQNESKNWRVLAHPPGACMHYVVIIVEFPCVTVNVTETFSGVTKICSIGQRLSIKN